MNCSVLPSRRSLRWFALIRFRPVGAFFCRGCGHEARIQSKKDYLTLAKISGNLSHVMTMIASINRLMAGQGTAYAVTPRDRHIVWNAYVKRTTTGQQEETT